MKPRLLYITHRTPWPPDRGDRIRTWNILKFLSKNADVDLICLADEPVSADTRRALQSVTRRLGIVAHSGRTRYLRGALSMARGRTVTEGLFDSGMVRAIAHQWSSTAKYTAAIASSSGIARYIQPPILKNCDRVWVDLIDVDSQKWLDYAGSSRFPMSAIYGLEGKRLRRLESRLASTTDRLLVVSDAERRLFRDFCPNAPVQAVGNGVDTEYFAPLPQPTVRHSCVFVGVLNYRPNSDAVKWFCREVWPHVRQRYPESVFRIVGKNPPPDVEALGKVDGVDVVGPVDDVRPWLHQSTCAVVPLRIARGVQNKVLEAMACGRPVVCSTAPLNGLDVEPGLHLLKADTAEEWLENLSCVFDDPVRAEELGVAASAWVELNHRWNACLEPLIELTSRHESQPVEVGS